MEEANRTSWVVRLAGLVGFVLGAAMLGYAGILIGMLALSQAAAGIHSDGALLAILVVPLCSAVGGGVAGAKAAVRLAKFWRGSQA